MQVHLPNLTAWYKFTTAISLALDSLRAHKLRTFLTLLGVIVGVSSVVMVGAAIEGMGTYAEVTTSKVFGNDSFLVAQLANLGRTTRKERAEKLRRNKPIREGDLEYLRATTGDRIYYSPYTQTVDDVKRGNLTFEAATVLGVSATLPEIREVPIVDGRFFTDQEERNRQPVAVIGDELRVMLFPDTSPVGETIKIKGIDFIVVGVQEKLGSSGARTNQDNPVYIPATLYFKLYQRRNAGFAVFGKAKPESGLSMEEALDLTRVALRTRFHALPNQPDNFDTLTPDSIRSFVENILALISAVVVPVTAISLVVGGIVIMNIMLVSVTERTREIGIRKSVGARRSDILLQFLIEAVLMSALGGAIGLALGSGVLTFASRFSEVPLRVTAPYAVLALLVSSAVGIMSGWYPASRASKLDPVVALRAE
ncbi:MAG: ABC transporter permease [Bryobacteraceae bacterium]|nr:ABC transporter permease [Bryobacteraceae bacterium]MDW8380213.1 ABC transporter permease [Bryobacterales bacterium]